MTSNSMRTFTLHYSVLLVTLIYKRSYRQTSEPQNIRHFYLQLIRPLLTSVSSLLSPATIYRNKKKNHQPDLLKIYRNLSKRNSTKKNYYSRYKVGSGNNLSFSTPQLFSSSVGRERKKEAGETRKRRNRDKNPKSIMLLVREASVNFIRATHKINSVDAFLPFNRWHASKNSFSVGRPASVEVPGDEETRKLFATKFSSSGAKIEGRRGRSIKNSGDVLTAISNGNSGPR